MVTPPGSILPPTPLPARRGGACRPSNGLTASPDLDGTNVPYRGHGGPASLRSRGSLAAQTPAHVGDGAARRRSGELPDEQGGEHGTKASQESSGEARGKEARGEKGPREARSEEARGEEGRRTARGEEARGEEGRRTAYGEEARGEEGRRTARGEEARGEEGACEARDEEAHGEEGPREARGRAS